MLKPVRLALIATCALVGCPPRPVEADGRDRAAPPPQVMRAVMIGDETRMPAAKFTRAHGLDPATFRRRIAAVGVVRCGSSKGTGALVGAADRIVTAAHVLFDDTGALRGRSCTFEILHSGHRLVVPLRMDTIVCGSRRPYADLPMLDWAVARLQAPVGSITPLRMGGPVALETAVLLVSARTAAAGGGDPTVERCAVRRVTGRSAGLREIAIDCDAQTGDSGAPLMDAAGAIVGIYVGYRSTAPGAARPYSDIHYNFGVTIEGGFRSAISSAL